MEKKNNSFLIGQTIIIILLIAVIVIIVMGGNKKGSEPNKLEPAEKTQEEEISDTKETSKEANNSESVSKNSSNSTIKVYSSDDNRYYLILTEYPHKALNPKSSSTTSKDFKVYIDEYYGNSSFYGDYTLENGKIKLVIDSGCTATNGEFNCTLPDGVNVTSRNDSLNEIDLNYSENEIMFGNVKLTLR